MMGYQELADAVREDLNVCCDVYERTENLRQEIKRGLPGYCEAMSELDDECIGHENCYYGEEAARVVERMG